MSDFNKEFFRDIPRGVSSRYLNQQNVPQARWMAGETILKSETLTYDPNDPGDKILVGSFSNKLIGIADNRHIMTVAGSRSGKSVLLTANLLFYQGPVLITDPKAELANITAERRAAMGQKVYVLDPFHYASDRIAKYRASYNPLSILKIDSPTLIEDAGLIADAIVVQPPNQKDAHWDESGKAFIEGVTLLVVTHPRYEGRRNLVTVRELIMKALTLSEEESEDEEPLYALEQEMLDHAERFKEDEATFDLGSVIEGATRDFYEKPDRERDSVLSTVRRHTKFLDYGAMRRVLTGDDFDLADLKRDPAGVSIYLCFPATRINMSQGWLRIFINQLMDAVEREKTMPPAPVLVCLDEFPVLGYMRQLEKAVGLIASYGVKFWFILQDWNQGKALYKDTWESFAGNCAVMICFGNNDLTTTEYISKLLGKTPVETTRSGEVGREQQQHGLSGKSSSIELYDLVTPDEVPRLFSRDDRLKRQLVIWTGKPPMILQRVEYWDKNSPHHRVFDGKYEIHT